MYEGKQPDMMCIVHTTVNDFSRNNNDYIKNTNKRRMTVEFVKVRRQSRCINKLTAAVTCLGTVHGAPHARLGVILRASDVDDQPRTDGV